MWPSWQPRSCVAQSSVAGKCCRARSCSDGWFDRRRGRCPGVGTHSPARSRVCAGPRGSARQGRRRQARVEPARRRGRARRSAGSGALFRGRGQRPRPPAGQGRLQARYAARPALGIEGCRRLALRHRPGSGQSTRARGAAVCLLPRLCGLGQGGAREAHDPPRADHDDGDRLGRVRAFPIPIPPTARSPRTGRPTATATFSSAAWSWSPAGAGPTAVGPRRCLPG